MIEPPAMEDMEPVILRSDMIAWLRLRRNNDRKMIDAIIAELERLP